MPSLSSATCIQAKFVRFNVAITKTTNYNRAVYSWNQQTGRPIKLNKFWNQELRMAFRNPRYSRTVGSIFWCCKNCKFKHEVGDWRRAQLSLIISEIFTHSENTTWENEVVCCNPAQQNKLFAWKRFRFPRIGHVLARQTPFSYPFAHQ